MVVNGIEYEVQNGEYEGGTDLDKNTFDELQENIDDVFTGQESMGSIVVENIECKNLFDINTENATSNGTVGITSNQIVLSCSGAWAQTRFKKIKVKQGETYTLSFTVENPSANTVAIAIYKSDNSTKIANTQNYINTSFSEHLTFTANDTEIVIALVANNSSTTNTNSVTFSNIQLEKGDTATPFVEHKEFGYTINQLQANIFNLPARIINSNTNVDNLYTECGIKFYNIWESKPIGLPENVWAYGTLIVITNDLSYLNRWTNMQIYITATIQDSATNNNIGIFVRNGLQNWCRISGSKIEKTTS